MTTTSSREAGGMHHRAVVAHADAHVAALRAEAREVFADELEFGLQARARAPLDGVEAAPT